MNQIRILHNSAIQYNTTVPSQKELLQWHWRLGHANFKWIQRLASMPRKFSEGLEGKPIFRTKVKSVSSCPAPLCAACQMSKQTQWNPEVKVGSPIPEKDMLLKCGDLQPGDMVSIDQYVSTIPGWLLKTYGKEPKKDKYTGGTLLVDLATGYIYLGHQVSCKWERHFKWSMHLNDLLLKSEWRLRGIVLTMCHLGHKHFSKTLTIKGKLYHIMDEEHTARTDWLKVQFRLWLIGHEQCSYMCVFIGPITQILSCGHLHWNTWFGFGIACQTKTHSWLQWNYLLWLSFHHMLICIKLMSLVVQHAFLIPNYRTVRS
jgi:hypothetical protein